MVGTRNKSTNKSRPTYEAYWSQSKCNKPYWERSVWFSEGKGTRDDIATLRILAGIQLVIYLKAAEKDCSGAYSGILRLQWTDAQNAVCIWPVPQHWDGGNEGVQRSAGCCRQWSDVSWLPAWPHSSLRHCRPWPAVTPAWTPVWTAWHHASSGGGGSVFPLVSDVKFLASGWFWKDLAYQKMMSPFFSVISLYFSPNFELRPKSC